jgi:hypothetical protein
METPKVHLLETRVEFQKHYTIPELAKIWGFAPATVRHWFENEPGVIRVGERRLRKGKRRGYVSLRVPESIAMKVYRRHTEAA